MISVDCGLLVYSTVQSGRWVVVRFSDEPLSSGLKNLVCVYFIVVRRTIGLSVCKRLVSGITIRKWCTVLCGYRTTREMSMRLRKVGKRLWKSKQHSLILGDLTKLFQLHRDLRLGEGLEMGVDACRHNL
jgi:hypothetical protein